MKKIVNFRAVPIMLVSMILGIVVVAMSSFRYGILAAGVAIIIAIVLFCIPKIRKFAFQFLLVTIALIIGVTSTSLTVELYNNTHTNAVFDVVVTGRVSSDSVFDSMGAVENYFIIDDVTYTEYDESGEVTSVKQLKDKVSVTIDKTTSALTERINVGDYVTFHSVLAPIRLVVTDSVNMSRYASGIGYTCRAMGIHIDSKAPDKTFVDTVRVKAKNLLATYTPGGSGEVIYSMIFGNEGGITHETLRDFREIGIAHLFAVSGLHVAVLSAAVSFILRICHGGKYLEYIVSMCAVVLYGVLTGFGVSVARAIVMLAVYKTGKLCRQRHCPLSSLSIAGVIILMFSPLQLFTLSFQMSMLAIIGILFFSEGSQRMLAFLPKRLASGLAMTISVNIALIPIMLSAFGRVSLIFVLANLIIVPVMSFIFPFVVGILLLGFCTHYFMYLMIPLGYIVYGVMWLAGAMGSVPFLEIEVSIGWLGMSIYACIMAVVSRYFMVSGKIKMVLATSMAVVFALLVCISSYHWIDTGTRVQCIKTVNNYNGTTDYVMIHDSGKYYLLVNGVYDKYTAQDISDYMYRYKISHIDVLVDARFDEREAYQMVETYDMLNPTILVTKANKDMTDILHSGFKNEIYPFYGDGKISLSVENTSNILAQVRTDHINREILLCDAAEDGAGVVLPEHSDDIDILFAHNQLDSAKYLLSPDGYLVTDGLYNNFANSHFTFVIKNDRIVVR